MGIANSFFGVLKYMYPVRMAKEVVIYNGRLTCLMVLLQLLLVFFLVQMFVGSQAYLVETTAQMVPLAWRSSHSGYAAAVEADSDSPVCSAATKRKYDFQYSGDSYFVYADNECVEIPSSERAVKTGNSIIYFPSYFMEEKTHFIYDADECARMANQTESTLLGLSYHPASQYTSNNCGEENYNWGSSCPSYEYNNGKNSVNLGASNLPPNSDIVQCQVYLRKNFLIKGVSKQSMAFSHAYEDSNPDLEVEKGKSAWTPEDIKNQESLGGLKARKVMSVVERFANGQYVEFDCGRPIKGQCRFKPGETISLSLGEWAIAAGVDFDDATTVNMQAIGTNTFYPAKSDIPKPLLRNTGFELTLQVAYFDLRYLDEDYGDFEGVVAKVQVKSNIDWASRMTTDYGRISYSYKAANSEQAETRFRYYYGVRFVFKEGASGKFGHLVIPALLALMAVIAVYMGFIGQFMQVFLTKMLGDTSRNYKRSQQDSFVPDRDGQQTMPAKAIMAAAAFQYLVDKQRAGGFTQPLGETKTPRYNKTDEKREGTHEAETDGAGAKGVSVIVGTPANTAATMPRDPWGASLDADFLFDVLKVTFGNQLDEESMKMMAFNVFTSISRQETFGSEGQVGQGANADMRYARAEELADTPVMHLESFVRAVCRNDPVDIAALVNMYDLQDTTSCVESTFGEPLNVTRPGQDRRGRRRTGADGKTDLTSFFG